MPVVKGKIPFVRAGLHPITGAVFCRGNFLGLPRRLPWRKDAGVYAAITPLPCSLCAAR